MKEQDKTPEKNPNQMEIRILPHKEFKARVIKIITRAKNRGIQCKLQQRYRKHKKNESELKKIITEMKNTLEGTNSKFSNTEDCISNLEDRIVEMTQSELQKERRIFLK